MSHGDGESSRVNDSGDAARRAQPGADEFGRAVSKVAVAQICEGVGFLGIKESALDSLADIAIRYLRDLGKMANYYANLAGRTESNVFDVVRGFEDLESLQGFSGAADVTHCLAGSGTMKGLVQYVGTAEENPFAQPLPRFPVVKDRRLIPSFEQMGEASPGKHLPNWLPAFPDPHTYIHSPMWNERKTDPREDKIEQARQRRKAERSLLSLQQRLLCNGSSPGLASTSVPVSVVALDGGNDGKGLQLQGSESNPFLEPPLQPGEKDVSPVVLPSKLSDESAKGNRSSSVLEAFAPAIQAVKNGVWMDGEGEEERRLLPNSRPPVHLNFRPVKKFLGESSDFSLLKKGSGRPANWVLRDEERDEKKRRAEFILRQSMENPQELNQA
ncbi:putative bromodomain associated domain, transcription factor TFIID, subunit 8 [Rosa chinensis]|uniref:Transcription initiation factor TFIID subunit 8 n=1 Tax=Rosa chinensis TaxID=74649 RepID=A0A2P6RAZ5_ROSCH|nr:transcription initiation factor TFIID subunit 8 [Rosa chinensis]PRQ43597.1 putative bromodomain associated domain, transcription factor TFIID, subunit 8 [Rosa chinensis]